MLKGLQIKATYHIIMLKYYYKTPILDLPLGITTAVAVQVYFYKEKEI